MFVVLSAAALFAACRTPDTQNLSDPPTLVLTEHASALPSHTPSSDTQTPSGSPSPATVWTKAAYLGVKGYGSVDINAVLGSDEPLFMFLVDGEVKYYYLKDDEAHTLKNSLLVGYEHRLIVKGCTVEAAVVDEMPPNPEDSPVEYSAGLRTLKNFLSAAMQPLGHTLYVYGGGWNWQDDGASVQARSIGASGTWRRFFDEQTADYLYKDANDRSGGFYPFGGWNEYFFAGLDCSGYIGWTVYNTLESETGQDGYVYKSTDIAKTYASLGLGAYSREAFGTDSNPLLPGDIVSISGHAYIVVGTCADGSILILHSSPTDSLTGAKGGGVQFGAIDRAGRGEKCDAYRLAFRYQSLYFPEWAARYPVEMRPFGKYLSFDKSGSSGVFRWYRDKRGLNDPDGYSALSAEEILADLFCE
ncbi:MAG: hypothetical protein IKS90_03250 [Clostridia bacterium]|nr:hypothetical protein [Clostridia bacterium]